MNKRTLIFIFASLALFFLCGYFAATYQTKADLDKTIAVSWGDGKYGSAFYGAHVWYEIKGKKVIVQARVALGRGNSYYYDCGQLGTAVSVEEAVERWGHIEWHEDGLHIGNYFLPRTQLESHR